VTEAAKIIISKLDEFVGKIERGETNEEIIDFETNELETRRLYIVGGDFNEEEEEDYDEPES
jgi:hypothetical protein